MTPELEKLKNEYLTQDNRFTAYPIFVTVQELVCVGVLADGYSVNCLYGDGETRTEYVLPEDSDLYFHSEEELEEYLKDEGEEAGYKKEDFDEAVVGYIWHPVEFFLTVKGANEYIAANQHNHGKLRTYIHHFESRNYEMRSLLKSIGFERKEQ